MIKKNNLPCGRPSPVSEASSPEEKKVWESQLQNYLAAQGLKSSAQRSKIVQVILSEKGHFKTQEIVRKVQESDPTIGAATVYRNIKLLSDAKILKETLMDAQGGMVYELGGEGHHDHIVCLDCGQIFEFHDEKIESCQESLTRKLRFTQARHRHVIYAKCQYLT